MPLGEYNGRPICATFEYEKGYTGNSGELSIGPLIPVERAKRAICALIDAEKDYLVANNLEAITDQSRLAFKESPEYKKVFDKYKLQPPQ